MGPDRSENPASSAGRGSLDPVRFLVAGATENLQIGGKLLAYALIVQVVDLESLGESAFLALPAAQREHLQALDLPCWGFQIERVFGLLG